MPSKAYPFTADQLIEKYAAEIKGKVLLVTGVSPNTLGALFVEAIQKGGPSLIILAGRTQAKLEEEAKKITSAPTRLLQLDLSSFKSVRAAAEVVKGYEEKIDVLVNNAGIMAVPYSKTEDGLEMHFQANHLSHFLFSNLITERLAENARIVNVSSNGYRLGQVRYFDYNFHDGESYNKWIAYGQSKTAQLLFSRSIAANLGPRGIRSYALHPGVYFDSNLGNHLEEYDSLVALDKQMGHSYGWTGFDAGNAQEVIANHVYASFAPELKEHNGAYIEGCRPMAEEDIQPWALGDLEASKCWALSEKLVGQTFSY